MDIYSRKIVGWTVQEEESGDAASKLIRKAALAEGLARATVVGAAALAEVDDRSPRELRAAVTSPGGTTEADIRCRTPLLRSRTEPCGSHLQVVRPAVLARTRVAEWPQFAAQDAYTWDAGNRSRT